MRNVLGLFALTLSLAVLLPLGGCADTIQGECNSCPGWSSINTDGCAEAAEAAGCMTGEVMEVTDDSCGLGMPPQTHLVCVYTGCAEDVDCTRFANR